MTPKETTAGKPSDIINNRAEELLEQFFEAYAKAEKRMPPEGTLLKFVNDARHQATIEYLDSHVS